MAWLFSFSLLPARRPDGHGVSLTNPAVQSLVQEILQRSIFVMNVEILGQMLVV